MRNSETSSDAAEVLSERRGAAGIIVLNRPRALNAISLGMVRAMRRQLDAWRDDGGVRCVIVKGAGDRAFSAGGDIREAYELGRAGRQQEALVYWREEYALNAVIKTYPKPCVSLIDGIVMGGGVGISVHGSHRIAGDKFLFAMPEVNIGFFPDVGATWFLPRMPGALGRWVALTGDRMRADDGIAAGIATHRVPSERFVALEQALCDGETVDDALARLSVASGNGPVTAMREAVDRHFAGARVEDIVDSLDAAAASANADADWASATAATIRTRSPTSLKIALAQVQRGASMSFEECLRTEFRIVSRIVHGHDFYEGVRSVLVDKDNAPVWRPASLSQVSGADVERYFAPLPDELVLR